MIVHVWWLQLFSTDQISTEGAHHFVILWCEVQRVAKLTAVVFRYITRNKVWAESEADLLTLSFSITQHQIGISEREALQPASRGVFRASWRGSVDCFRLENTMLFGSSRSQNTHGPTNIHIMLKGDGGRWMVRSGWYDCRGVKEDKRETDEPPLYQQIDEKGSWGGERLKQVEQEKERTPQRKISH